MSEGGDSHDFGGTRVCRSGASATRSTGIPHSRVFTGLGAGKEGHLGTTSILRSLGSVRHPPPQGATPASSLFPQRVRSQRASEGVLNGTRGLGLIFGTFRMLQGARGGVGGFSSSRFLCLAGKGTETALDRPTDARTAGYSDPTTATRTMDLPHLASSRPNVRKEIHSVMTGPDGRCF